MNSGNFLSGYFGIVSVKSWLRLQCFFNRQTHTLLLTKTKSSINIFSIIIIMVIDCFAMLFLNWPSLKFNPTKQTFKIYFSFVEPKGAVDGWKNEMSYLYMTVWGSRDLNFVVWVFSSWFYAITLWNFYQRQQVRSVYMLWDHLKV